MVAVVVSLAAFELLRATKVAHDNHCYFSTSLCGALIPFGIYFSQSVWQISAEVPITLCALVLLCMLFIQGIRRFGSAEAIPAEHLMCCLFGGVLIPTFLSCLLRLRIMENGHLMVLLPILCAFLTDTGAYFVGIFLGKHRGITQVSPNKSLEGYIGGILFGGIFMLIYGLVLDRVFGLHVSLPIMAVYGLVGSAVTELGDLSFSFIKRQFGVKDYGDLLPGHGGMLDRFDSMIFAAPALWIMVALIPAF